MAYRGVLDDIRACIESRRPARLPLFALSGEFDLAWNRLTCRQSRTDVDAAVAGIVRAVRHFDYDWALVFPDDYIELEPLGLAMVDDPELPAMVSSYLPMTPENLRRFGLPDPARDMRLPIHLEMIRRVRAALGEAVCVTGRIAAPFSALGLIYGIESLMIQMLDDPGIVRRNLGFFIDHQIAFGRAQLKAGAHALWLGDCLASSALLSPALFTEFAAEAAATVSAELMRAGANVIYHTAETSLEHLRLQVRLPSSAVNLGEGVSIARLREELGPGRCLMGNFDPMILRDGTPEQAAAAAAEMIRENSAREGYIFNTGEGVMTDSPVPNVEAMMRAARALAARPGNQ